MLAAGKISGPVPSSIAIVVVVSDLEMDRLVDDDDECRSRSKRGEFEKGRGSGK